MKFEGGGVTTLKYLILAEKPQESFCFGRELLILLV